MESEDRRKIVEQKLAENGETLTSWAKHEGVSLHIVSDLIDGKLLGTRGVSQEVRRKMEKSFGNIF